MRAGSSGARLQHQRYRKRHVHRSLDRLADIEVSSRGFSMKYNCVAWFLSSWLLGACQWVSGLAPLEVAPDKSDAATLINSVMGGGDSGESQPVSGSGGMRSDATDGGVVDGGRGAKDAGAPDPAFRDTGPACESPEGSDCDWLTECGCDDNEHCQALGAQAKGTCVKRGRRKVGETCRSADECEAGTCEQRVCRAYCRDRCDDGLCLPATGEGGKSLASVSVCWKSCQAGNNETCGEGTTCQTRDIEGRKAALCVPPADPCPTTEDGQCDEPVMCAAGTDSVDCSCEKEEGAECNHVAQCGCPKGKSCEFSNITHEPVCALRDPGGLGANAVCSESQSCAAGLTCTFNPYGSCDKYCTTSTDCPGAGDECVAVGSDGADIRGLRVCSTACSEASPCPPNNSCYKYETGSFCRTYVPEIQGATCNLTYQLGCDGMPGAACDLDLSGGNLTARCLPHTGMLPVSAHCDDASECEAGAVCIWGACRRFCDLSLATSATDAPGCNNGVCVAPPLASDGSAAPFICIVPCSSDAQCDVGLQCQVGSVGDQAGYCRAPLTDDCTVNDGECDEPLPRGTGLCAPGYDTADCIGTP